MFLLWLLFFVVVTLLVIARSVSDEAIQTSSLRTPNGLLRFARNDGEGTRIDHPRAARSFSFCALIDSRALVQSASDQLRNS